ncbi:hypothetical protein OAH34_02155 [bacterium]|nr:hypothetical protein [bacterium]
MVQSYDLGWIFSQSMGLKKQKMGIGETNRIIIVIFADHGYQLGEKQR